jgi:hypothetical protein
VAGRRNIFVARFVMIFFAHAASSAAVGVQTKMRSRLGEALAGVASNGPSIRIVPTCGKNVYPGSVPSAASIA